MISRSLALSLPLFWSVGIVTRAGKLVQSVTGSASYSGRACLSRQPSSTGKSQLWTYVRNTRTDSGGRGGWRSTQ